MSKLPPSTPSPPTESPEASGDAHQPEVREPSSRVGPARPSRAPVAGASNGRLAGLNVWSWCLLLSVFFFGFSVDLASKYAAFHFVGPEPVILDRDEVLAVGPDLVPAYTRHIVPKLLDFKLILNPGAVFGIGPGKRWFFIVFTVIAMGTGLIVFAFRTRAGQVVLHTALALVLAGAAGNLYDRLFYGAVRDFLYIFPGVHLPFGLRWPQGHDELFPWVFNIADVLLLLGIGVLMALTLLHPPAKTLPVEAPEETPRPGESDSRA